MLPSVSDNASKNVATAAIAVLVLDQKPDFLGGECA